MPVRNDRKLFEFLILEGAQAGLSWDTILKKRAAYRKAYLGFDPKKVARFDAKKKRALMADAGIVRNRSKIEASVVEREMPSSRCRRSSAASRATSGASSAAGPS